MLDSIYIITSKYYLDICKVVTAASNHTRLTWNIIFYIKVFNY